MTALSQFSPITRKILAAGLLILVVLLVWSAIISPLVGAVQSELTALDDARFQRMRLERLDARPPAQKVQALPANLIVAAGSHAEASTAFVAHFSSMADGSAVLIEAMSERSAGGTGRLVGVDFKVSGSEEQVAHFINLAEQAAPAIRFRDWKIEAIADEVSQIQFTGQALGAWSKP